MFRWNEEMIRFMRDAAEYGHFYQDLAQRLLACLPPQARVCDVGCGLGYLSLELAPYCSQVDAVDISAQALSVLEENIHRWGADNIAIHQLDALASPLPRRDYDALIFCFFGSIPRSVELAQAHSRGRALLVKRNDPRRGFSLSHAPAPGHTLAEARRELERLGARCVWETFDLEMGQPLRGPEEAVLFYRTYNQGEEADPERVRCQLIATGDPRFPWYLPKTRSLGLIRLEA